MDSLPSSTLGKNGQSVALIVKQYVLIVTLLLKVFKLNSDYVSYNIISPVIIVRLLYTPLAFNRFKKSLAPLMFDYILTTRPLLCLKYFSNNEFTA